MQKAIRVINLKRPKHNKHNIICLLFKQSSKELLQKIQKATCSSQSGHCQPLIYNDVDYLRQQNQKEYNCSIMNSIICKL